MSSIVVQSPSCGYGAPTEFLIHRRKKNEIKGPLEEFSMIYG